MVNSRAKGARGERELAAFFRERGYEGAKRGQQRSGLEQADVIGGPEGFHIECKRVQALNVWAAYEQARRDAGDDEEPLVCMRRNGTPWLAVVDLATFTRMVQMLELLYPEFRREL